MAEEKKRKWLNERQISNLWEQFYKAESIICPKGKSQLEVSVDTEDEGRSDEPVFTLTCKKCGGEVSKKFTQTLEERYVQFSRIGRGAMGEVFLGRHYRLGRRVALKEMFENLSEEKGFPERFEREVRLHSTLVHPHIISIYDRNAELAPQYIVMEYAEGGSFDSVLSPSVGSDKKFVLFLQACGAISFAHSKGIIHRDVKPQNILIDKEGNAKVSDFGLAVLYSRDSEVLTDTSALIGSFPYMAPEQYANPKTVDFRADVYSLGIIFYQILTNRLPFIYPPLIKDIKPSLEGDPDVLFKKMIAEDPRKRIPSVREVFEVVADFMKRQGFFKIPKIPLK